ncbi:hypothetical protein D3C77_331960 [compost metagenome]
MERHPCLKRQLPQELVNELHIKAAYPAGRILRAVFEVRPVAAIDHNLGQRFIHRNKYACIAFDAFFVAQRFPQTLPEANPDILHRMMIINFNIAMRINLQIELAMLRKQVKHMIQKRHIGLQVGLPAAIYRET